MTARRLPAPRWQTPLPATVVGSWGPAVAAWAEAELGISLDRWQRRVLNRALAYDRFGRLVHRLYLASTARQQGKTVIVRALVGWALTALETPPWSTILGLAHDRAQARIPYTAVLADLAPIKRRLGRAGAALALTRYLGIRSDIGRRHRAYDIGSRESRDAIRGLSVDLGLFDEVRTQRTYETWAALEPTTTARPEPLIFAISTAGDDRSVLLRDWWERGRRIIAGAEPFAGFGMTWYAAGDDQDHDDPRAWLAANPAMAEGRLDVARIREARLSSSSDAMFVRERLNLWTEGTDEWLPPGLWPQTVGRQPHDAQRVVLGVEAVPTWRRVSVTVALVTDAGIWIGVAGEIDATLTLEATVAPDDLVALLARLRGEWRPAAIAYSAAAAAARHVEAWAETAKVPTLPLGARQIRSASSLFRSELVGGRLTHADDPLLAAQVRVARPSSAIEGGDWYLSIRESLGDVDAIRSAAWAAWAALAPADAVAAPQVFV